MRDSSRRVCSSMLTSSQYLMRMMPESTITFSTLGTALRKLRAVFSSQKPMTRSTPARLYQLRSKITTSPAAGRCGRYRCTYIWLFSRSVGAGSATTRNTRGLTRSVIALMVPPLPAPSRPSNTMHTLRPLCFIHAWALTSSTCNFLSCPSYSLRPMVSSFLDMASGLLLFVLESPGGDLAIQSEEFANERSEFRVFGDQPLSLG